MARDPNIDTGLSDEEREATEVYQEFGPGLGGTLVDLGYVTLAEISEATDEELLSKRGIDEDVLLRIRNQIAFDDPENLEGQEEEGLTRSRLFNLLDDDVAEKLADAGLTSVSAVESAEDERILDIHGIGPATLDDIRDAIPFVEAEDEEEVDDTAALADFGLTDPPGGTLADAIYVEGTDYVEASTAKGSFRCYLNVSEYEWVDAPDQQSSSVPSSPSAPPVSDERPKSVRVQRIADSQS